VTLTREKYLDEVGHDAQLFQLARIVFFQRKYSRVWRTLGLAASDVILLPDTLCHCGKGKGIKASAHIPAGIPILQSPRQNRVQCRTRNQSQLSGS